jgi:S-formylglutathione hydrolase FrmB
MSGGAHDRFRRGDHAQICVEAGFYTEWKVPDREGAVPQRETFHVVELLSLLEREYGASDVRMAAGLSMGGYGALRYAIRHPGLLLGVASLSGFVHITGPGMASLLGLLALREGMRPGLIWGSRRRCAEPGSQGSPPASISGRHGGGS